MFFIFVGLPVLLQFTALHLNLLLHLVLHVLFVLHGSVKQLFGILFRHLVLILLRLLRILLVFLVLVLLVLVLLFAVLLLVLLVLFLVLILLVLLLVFQLLLRQCQVVAGFIVFGLLRRDSL